MNARELSDGWDVCLIHDPQPAALYELVPEKAKGWVWRCHIDLSTPNPDTIAQLLPYIEDYPQSLFHMQQYVPSGMNGHVNVVPPAIDPLTPKNMALSPEDAAFVCGQFGIDVDRPLMCQVSRFDPWKDPLGVIDAYRLVKEEMPEVQLALVGSMASDDPEGWDFFNATIAHADGDPDMHILNNFNNVGAIEVNAFQSHSDVLIQKSTREGFGLTVSEAIWKARPFIGGDVGGIPLQIEDGVTGFLVSSVEECAERALEILRDPALGTRWDARQGARAHALPDAALPARLPADLQRAAGVLTAMPAQRTPLVLVSNRGPVTFHADGEVQRGSGGLVTALTGLASHREAIWIASAMNEYDAEVSRATAAAPSRCARPAGGEYQVRLVVSDPDAYDRFYNVFANPMLWFIQHYLWDLSNAPDIRREEIEAFEFGYNVVNEDLARAVVEEIEGVEEPVVMVHDYHLYTLPGPGPPGAPGRVPAPLRPHPVDAAGRLARAADADPRGDLRGPAGQRHHRLPHPLLPPQLPAVLPRPDGPRGRLRRAASCDFERPRGVGARLPAADRPRGDAADRRGARVSPSSSASCCAAAATS